MHAAPAHFGGGGSVAAAVAVAVFMLPMWPRRGSWAEPLVPAVSPWPGFLATWVELLMQPMLLPGSDGRAEASEKINVA